MIPKKLLIIIAFLFAVQLQAQKDKILFEYDTAGNQTKRELCVNCTRKEATKELKDLVAEDFTPLEESLTEDQVSYYPNPVQEELHIKWELINNRTVTAIMVFNNAGTLVKDYQNTSNVQLQTLSFGSLPTGVYLIMMQYSDGKQKTFKIIKQ
jgi:hypothetical protein